MSTRNLVKRALMKNDSFKGTMDNLKERLSIFDKECSLEYFEVKFVVVAPMIITSHRKSAREARCWCSLDQSTLNYGMEFDLIIQSSWEYNSLKVDVNNVINSVVDNIMSTCELCSSWEEISIIQIDGGHTYINNLIAWGNREVGIYHEEQECGEGWLTMPKKPTLYEEKVIIRRKDEPKVVTYDEPLKRVRRKS